MSCAFMKLLYESTHCTVEGRIWPFIALYYSKTNRNSHEIVVIHTVF